MLAGSNTSGNMGGPKARGSSKKHHVDTTIDHLLKRVEPKKLVALFHFDALANGSRFTECIQAPVYVCLVDVGDCRQFSIVVGMQSLRSGAAAPASASDKPDFDGLSCRLRRYDGGKLREQHTAERTAPLQKFAA
jgi:hypothetical protein